GGHALYVDPRRRSGLFGERSRSLVCFAPLAMTDHLGAPSPATAASRISSDSAGSVSATLLARVRAPASNANCAIALRRASFFASPSKPSPARARSKAER